MIREKRARPDDFLVSQLVAVEEAGERLTEDEIVCTTIVLLNAGHEATVNTLGNGMRAFMLHPDQWHRVTTGEVSGRTAVEEMIRWDAPLQLFERWCSTTVSRSRASVCRSVTRVAMLFGAANRGSEHFPRSTRFDAGRGDATHVGFGGGIHFCIGAPLARLELEVMRLGVGTEVPDLRLGSEPTYHPTFVIRGLTGLRLARGA